MFKLLMWQRSWDGLGVEWADQVKLRRPHLQGHMLAFHAALVRPPTMNRRPSYSMWCDGCLLSSLTNRRHFRLEAAVRCGLHERRLRAESEVASSGGKRLFAPCADG